MEEERTKINTLTLSRSKHCPDDILTVKQWINILECCPEDYEVVGWRHVLISLKFERKEDK